MERFVWIMFGALIFASCAKEPEDIVTTQAIGREVPVELNLSVSGLSEGGDQSRAASPRPASRVIPGDMNPGGVFDDARPIIRNIWIIQFDGDSQDARMIGAPRYLSVEDGIVETDDYPLTISLPLVEVTSPCYTVFVANIRQGSTYNWNLTPESTFANVITRVKTITGENGAFEDFTEAGGPRTLLMSAVTTDPVMAGTILEPEFMRNVAKITLNLSLENPDMSIASVRIRNVSNRIVFADAALQYNGVSASTVFPVDASLIDYAPITDVSAMPVVGEPATFSWYVPRNQQGVNMLSKSVREKTFFAPVIATHIEIVAVKDHSTSIFRIYPGADMVTDFNLTPNYEYTVGLNVVDIGTDPSDSRVQTLTEVVDYSGFDTPGSRSNSFIINPAPVAGGGNRVYLIGVHQVNRYWGDSKSGYGNNPDNVIKEGDPWVVSLIWSDLAGLFSTESTSTTAITLLDNNGTVVGGGTGPNQAFAIQVPPNLPAGNFLLGIKKVNGADFLWSWHFWVTDYAPDNFNRSLIDHGVYTYRVPGGQVERLVPGTSGTNNDLLWTPTGLYADRVMMDRFLGTTENNFTTTFAHTSRGMLHYQFGRKDPMPGRITLFTDPNSNFFTPTPEYGVVVETLTANNLIPISKSVAHPWVYYGISGNWTKEADETGYLWNDPYINHFNAGKSIYDPCPVGWKMPIVGTWLDFLRMEDGRYVTTINNGRDLGWTMGRGIGTADVAVNGLRYWPGTTLDAPVGGRIWYPAIGGRNAVTSASNGIGTGVSLWTSTPANPSNANSFTGGVNSTSVRGAVRGGGYAVRCITDGE